MILHPFVWIRHTLWRPVFLTLLALTALTGAALRLLDRALTSAGVPNGIVTFELAGSQERAQEILSIWEGANVLRHSALSLGLDFLFLSLYAGTLGLAALLAGRILRRRSKWWWIGAVASAWAVVSAAALDVVENSALIRILLGASGEMWPAIALWAAVPKFALVTGGLLFAVVAWVAVPVLRYADSKRPKDQPVDDPTTPETRVSEIQMPGLPTPLSWQNAPDVWSVWPPRCLEITAGPNTDWFVDPRGSRAVSNAPTALFSPGEGDFILSASVQVKFASTFDAGVLMLYIDHNRWAKLCFEFSPRREPMVVSVVTKGYSDDCNAAIIKGDQVRLRLSRIGQAFALHFTTDDVRWHLVRHFTVGAIFTPLQIGFSAQSPTGQGCSATFCDIRFERETLEDLRA